MRYTNVLFNLTKLELIALKLKLKEAKKTRSRGPKSALTYQNVTNTMKQFKGTKTIVKSNTIINGKNVQKTKVLKNNMMVNHSRVAFNPMFSFGSFDLSKVNAMMAVKSRHNPMLSTLLRLLVACGGKISPSYVKVTVVFLNFCRRILLAQGLPGLVNYLKASSVLIQQVIAGYRIRDLTPLKCRVSRSKSGLPRFLPVQVRKAILRNNIVMIKYILTLLSIYRVLDFEGKVKLDSITDPSTASSRRIEDMLKYIPVYANMLLRRVNKTSLYENLKDIEFSRILKSSPTMLSGNELQPATPYSSHYLSQFIALLRLNSDRYAVLRKAMYIIYIEFMQFSTIKNIFLIEYISLFEEFTKVRSILPKVMINGPLGKLGLKYEAAGKVRVFAMVDYFTQILLKPIHKALMKLNSTLIMDGTFNQYKPLLKANTWKEMYSLDLTAATDRLPTSIQVSLLKHLFKSAKLADAWLNLLVARGYWLPKLGKTYIYSTGQPMGALSS